MWSRSRTVFSYCTRLSRRSNSEPTFGRARRSAPNRHRARAEKVRVELMRRPVGEGQGAGVVRAGTPRGRSSIIVGRGGPVDAECKNEPCGRSVAFMRQRGQCHGALPPKGEGVAL